MRRRQVVPSVGYVQTAATTILYIPCGDGEPITTTTYELADLDIQFRRRVQQQEGSRSRIHTSSVELGDIRGPGGSSTIDVWTPF